MSDSSIQSKEEDASPQSNELTDRLLRRSTEPAGVIDTFQPRRQYERTRDWLVERFSLLDRFKSRYAITNDANENASLVLAKSPQPQATILGQSGGQAFAEARGNQAGLSDSIASALSHGERGSIASQANDPLASSYSPPAQFRVSRSRADRSASTTIASPEIRSADATSKADAANNTSSDSASRNIASEHLIFRIGASPDAIQNFSSQSAASKTGDQVNLKTSEISTGSAGSSAAHRDSPSTDSFSPSASVSTQSERLMKSDRGSSRSGPRAVEIPTGGSSSPDLHLRLQHSEKGAARSRELSSPTAYATAARMIQRNPEPRPPNEPPRFFEGRENATMPSAIIPTDAPAQQRAMFSDDSGSSVGRERIASAQPAADLTLAAPTVQRQQVTSSRTETASSSIARSAEMRGASSQEKPTIIWRQTDHGSSFGSRPAGGNDLPLVASSGREVSLARQNAQVQPAASGISTGSDVQLSRAASSANKLDIAQVAEQVWRLISRRLEVERERRGR